MTYQINIVHNGLTIADLGKYKARNSTDALAQMYHAKGCKVVLSLPSKKLVVLDLGEPTLKPVNVDFFDIQEVA